MDDYSSQRELNVGEEFTIHLESNPTTGYRWHPVYDGTLLKLISNDFTLPPSRLIGEGGTEHFNFRAIKLGRTTIKMLYNRRWEKENLKEKEFSIRIT